MVVQTSITPRIVHLLHYSNVPQTQVCLLIHLRRISLTSLFPSLFFSFLSSFFQELAARILSYFAPGPRIASTPEDSLLHPNQMFFKKLVIAEGAVPILIKLVESPYNEVKVQVRVCPSKNTIYVKKGTNIPAFSTLVLTSIGMSCCPQP